MFSFLNGEDKDKAFEVVEEQEDAFGGGGPSEGGQGSSSSSFLSYFSRNGAGDGGGRPGAAIELQGLGELEDVEAGEGTGSSAGMFSSWTGGLGRGGAHAQVGANAAEVEPPPSFLSSIKTFVGMEEPPRQPETWQQTAGRKCNELGEVLCPCARLSYTQRIIGFGVCAAVGVLLGWLAVSLIIFPFTFGLLYSLCILCFLLSTFFLAGPMEQAKSMMQPHRIVSSLVFLGALVGTIIIAITVGSTILILIGIVIQTAALVWYVASYVPFARDAISSGIKSITGLFTS